MNEKRLQASRSVFAGLPLKNDLVIPYASSLAIAVIMAVAAVAGLFYQTVFYPTDELRHWFVINDAVNLAAGLPLLVGSFWLARRGALIGLLSWPGALFYVLYTYLPYLFSIPFSVLFLLHLLLVTMSAYALIGLIVGLNGNAVRQRLIDDVPARTAGGILVGLAILIIVRQLVLMAGALTNQTGVTNQEIALWIDDFAVACPALLIVGVQLWRRKTLGYVAGGGLLLQYGVLALGLIPGLLSATPVDSAGIVVVLIMAALCFAPWAFFVRGAGTTAQTGT